MSTKEEKALKVPLLAKEGSLIDFLNFIKSDELAELRKRLTNKRQTVSETDESYRTINSWSEAGLLLEDKDRENGWRKFSLIDLCWLRIIRELRKIGFGLDAISVLKNCLFNSSYTKKTNKTAYFEFFIASALTQSVYLVVTSDGRGDFAFPQEYATTQILMPLPTAHVIININQILSDATGNSEYANNKTPLILLESKELELLNKISEGEISGARVKVRDNKIQRISYESLIDNPENTIEIIRKLLKEDGHREITIYQQGKRGYQIKRVDKT